MFNNHEWDSLQDQTSGDYAFMEETIKSDAKGFRKIMKRIGKCFGLGLVYGAAIAIGFGFCTPIAERIFIKQAKQIEIPSDDEVVNVVVDQDETSEPQNYTIEDYEKINAAMSKVATEAQKTVVKVSGTVKSGNHTTVKSATGLILADNGVELLILTDYTELAGVKKVQVCFSDETEASATCKEYSSRMNIAVYSVKKTEIKDGTWDKIATAKLGNSNAIGQAKPMIAIGNLYGYDQAVAYGSSSSVNQSVNCVDGAYHIIVTDIASGEHSNGILFDVKGQVLGMIMPQSQGESDGRVLTGIGISSLKREIQLMSNSQPIPYLGLTGTVLTEKMASEKNMPEGLYISEIQPDSPAMEAGVQNGDIVTRIDGKEITTVTGYYSDLMNKKVGNSVRMTVQRRGSDGYVELQFDIMVGVLK